MPSIPLQNFTESLPDSLPVSVVMERQPAQNPWVDYSYRAVSVLQGQATDQREVQLIHQQGELRQYLFSGLQLALYVDECESYYHNLMSPQPGCFVVASEVDDANEMPAPYLVSLSFDEVHAYLEGDEQVYAVAIPAALYQWAEAYILTHYVATKRRKRKLKNWKQGGDVAAQPSRLI